MKTRLSTFRLAIGLLSVASVFLAGRNAFATSGTWSPAAVSGDWHFAANWIPAYIPNSSTVPSQFPDVATFTNSIQHNLTISQSIALNDINFETFADAFTISLAQGSNSSLTIGSIGIQSGATNTETFVTNPSTELKFINWATAANGQANVTIITRGASNSVQSGGYTVFYGHSTAGNAKFVNDAGQTTTSDYGHLDFHDYSNAGHATITNNPGYGITGFGDFSNAAQATIVNKGSPNEQQFGGVTYFGGSSVAAGATIENECGNAIGFGGGLTVFEDTAFAGYGRFHNAGGCAEAGGMTYFAGRSNAGQGYFVTDGASPGGPGYGIVHFGGGPGTCSAGYGTFISNGATVGGGAWGAHMDFNLYSTADHGVFTMGGGLVEAAAGSSAQFVTNSTAANGAFSVNGGNAKDASGALVQFSGGSTAAEANFVANGGKASGATGGMVWFQRNSTAANADFTANGGEIAGAAGGVIRFSQTSSADGAIITANGGVNGGNGGLVRFASDTLGGTARITLNGNSGLDISYHYSPGLSIGSLQGDGNVFLGSSLLAIGANNLSTSFAGHFQDGGLAGGIGGGVAKIGSGTLTFEGRPTNDYVAESVSFSVITGSPIALNFAGDPDRVLSLIVDGVSQPPGVYGGLSSAAPRRLPQFIGSGTVLASARVVSRKDPNGPHPFDVDLPVIGSSGIECRSGGTNGDYSLVFNFADPITAVTETTVISGTGSVAGVTRLNAKTYNVALTGVVDAQLLTLKFSVSTVSGKSITISAPVGFLIADVNADGIVDSTDVGEVTSKVGQQVDATNFRDDVNGDGVIDQADVALVQSRSGAALP